MIARIVLSAALLLAVLSPVSAAIPSFGLQSVAAQRLRLRDQDFVIKRTRRPALVGPKGSYVVYETSARVNPVLYATDTQFLVADVVVRSWRPFFRHYHPRASELAVVRQGTFAITIWLEGFNPRIIRIKLRTGQFTTFPQALQHQFRCISKIDCIFTAVLNSADPGTIPV